MAGPYLWLRWELGPAVKGAWTATVGWPWSTLVYPETRLWLGATLPLLAGFQGPD